MGLLQFNNWLAFLPQSVLKYSNIKSDIVFYNISDADIHRQVVASYLKTANSPPSQACSSAKQKSSFYEAAPFPQTMSFSRTVR